MGNYRFDINEWLPRFPLSRHLDRADPDGQPRISAPAVTSPAHICDIEQLRAGLADQFDWGQAVPADIFIMGEGEPHDRHVTKIGGVPYRPARESWPARENGQPLQYLGQFCFADSRDLTGELPGDVLLLFAEDAEWPDTVHFEWQPLGLADLVALQEMPPSVSPFTPCHGFICRTANFPQARFLPKHERARYPIWRGAEVWSKYFVPCISATQIGEAPFYINNNPRPGRALCTLDTVSPEPLDPFPFVNRPTPLFGSEDEWLNKVYEPQASQTPWFTFGDTGCIYVFMDNHGRLHSELDCF